MISLSEGNCAGVSLLANYKVAYVWLMRIILWYAESNESELIKYDRTPQGLTTMTSYSIYYGRGT